MHYITVRTSPALLFSKYYAPQIEQGKMTTFQSKIYCMYMYMYVYCVCSGVGWMAAVVALNEDRAGPRFKRGEGVAGACGDGQ